MNSEREYQNRINTLEEEQVYFSKKQKNTEWLLNDLARIYQNRRDTLEEIYYYSKGTEAERDAFFALEDEEEEERQNKRKVFEGQEWLQEKISKLKKEQSSVEEDYYEWKKEEEGSNGKN